MAAAKSRRRDLPSLDGPRLAARLAGPQDAAALQACLDGAPEYFVLTEGELAAPDRARQMLADAEADPDRRIWLLAPQRGGPALGVLDLHLDQPAPGDAHVGLLLFRGSCQSIGYGGETVATLAHALATAGYRAVRVSVGDENPGARAFWEREGFADVGRLEGGVTVLERILR